MMTNKRRIIAVWAAAVFMLALIACGQTGGTEQRSANEPPAAAAVDPATASPSPASQAAEESPPPKTRVVQTVNGEVEIPVNPERLVATYYVGELAALGIKPIGTITRLLGEQNPNLAAYMEGVADVGATPNLEAIAALNPDLIIAFDLGQITFEDYSKIAPTVIIPWSADDVWAKLRTIAEIFDKEQEAERFIADYEAKAAEARKAIAGHIGADETITILSFYDKAIGAFGARDIGHAFYHGLALTPTPKVREKIEADPNFTSDWSVSLEMIPDYTADRIFVVVQEGASSYDSLQQLSLWRDLPAVRSNKVYELPAPIWFTYDPISVGVTLDEAVRLLTGN